MNINFTEIIQRPNAVILDIGTHNGDDSINFLKLFPDATVYAFEADPGVWSIFEANVASKIEYPNPRLHFVKAAVGDVDSKLSFYSSTNLKASQVGPSGTFQKPTDHLHIHPHVTFNEIEVDCVRLDTWFKGSSIDFIDFAWTDVNGAEIAMLKGGFDTFTNRTKYLQLECIRYTLWENQSTREEIVELLPNFTVLQDDGHNLLLKNNKLS